MAVEPLVKAPRVAIVHEWLVTFAGSEQVVANLLQVFPQADLFALVDFLDDETRARHLAGRRARTTFLQDLPFARTKYRSYLPLMPLAVEQHDLSGYDLVISSSHAVAKGVLTGPDQLHISYVHSPMRYAWDLQHQYLAEAGLTHGPNSWLARAMLHYMRLWDARSADGVDHFIANSDYIARRIAKAYRREAEVIYPPVELDAFPLSRAKSDYYLAASRLVPYKKMPLIVEAFARMPERRLVVIGDGPEYEKVKRKVAPNITLLGFQPVEVLRQHMQDARAFVFAAEEDFGITPVEAQACGTPVIAFGRGGARESVRELHESESPTGLFFHEQTPEAIIDAVERYERHASSFQPTACRENAARFSSARFREQIAECVASQLKAQRESRGPTAPAARSSDARRWKSRA